MKFLTLLIAAFFLNSTRAQTLDSVRLLFIQGENVAKMDPIIIPWNDTGPLISSKSFDKSKKPVVITYGWKSNFSSPLINATVGSFLTRRLECNIFVLDWSSYANKNYFAVVQSIPIIADFVTSNLKLMNGAYISVKDFHFVGHSLGSHLFGYIGRKLQETANITVQRISGLDPAGPLYFPNLPVNPIKALTASDAKFVDVIHTNSREAGTEKNIGHVDFYPNGGSWQPGCARLTLFNVLQYIQEDCNHNRAWVYFAESVLYDRTSRKFRSVKCLNNQLFSQNSCTGAPLFNYMGYHADLQARGSFYLTTNDRSPYSK